MDRTSSWLKPGAALLLASTSFCSLAHEGMWLPTLLQAIEGNMRTEGLLLSAEDLYSIQHSSVKDAIVLFGGGCTAEVISDQGLILTNHHCGFGAIQDHSSLEHDYLKNGFTAKSLSDELMNEGLTATFIVRMEDVTGRVLAALTPGMSEAERTAAVNKVAEAIAAEVKAAGEGTGVVRPFNYGNNYYLIVSETFRDVRLVCAPPGGVGKFGGDTDNWMWPRHTGDFSIFRIYASKDNKPVEFAIDNVPYKPKHSLPINMDGVRPGDFDMIYGFPGNTQRYLSSYAVDYIVTTGDPLRISMRDASLAVIDAAMRKSDGTRIQYADKQSGTSNAWKKWQGEVRGLKELNALEEKRTFEKQYRSSAAGKPEDLAALDQLAAAYNEFPRYAKARDLYSEFYLVGSEMLAFADAFRTVITTHEQLRTEGKLDAELAKLKGAVDGFFKDNDMQVDKAIFKAQLPLYRSYMDPELSPAAMAAIFNNTKMTPEAFVDDLYARSLFADPVKLRAALDGFSTKVAKKMEKDPALVLAGAVRSNYEEKIKPKVTELNERILVAMRGYVKGQIELFPEKGSWPDANSTLRLSYGHVEGSEPRDGVEYKPFTTLKGLVAKYKPNDAEFDLPPALLDAYARKDFAPYGRDENMTVCFTSSLHTTGGNSGSPVLNARGELIGLNFDRTWESTMSDIRFDPAKCRNIAVDARYLLFVIDKVCGAHRLIDEMKLVQHANEAPAMIALPIHR